MSCPRHCRYPCKPLPLLHAGNSKFLRNLCYGALGQVYGFLCMSCPQHCHCPYRPVLSLHAGNSMPFRNFVMERLNRCAWVSVHELSSALPLPMQTFAVATCGQFNVSSKLLLWSSRSGVWVSAHELSSALPLPVQTCAVAACMQFDAFSKLCSGASEQVCMGFCA